MYITLAEWWYIHNTYIIYTLEIKYFHFQHIRKNLFFIKTESIFMWWWIFLVSHCRFFMRCFLRAVQAVALSQDLVTDSVSLAIAVLWRQKGDNHRSVNMWGWFTQIVAGLHMYLYLFAFHYRIWPQYQPSWPPRYRGGPDGWEQCFLSFALPRERYPPGRHWRAGPYLYGSNAAS